MYQTFPNNTSGFSWTLEPGTDNGILFDQAQQPGEMMGMRPMFNTPTTFFSVDTGLSMGGGNDIDMSNLRMQFGGTEIDVGSGSGHAALVPLVSDITLLAAGENGWMLNPDGSCHLIYHTRGTCADCELAMHLYGMAAVPLPRRSILCWRGSRYLQGQATATVLEMLTNSLCYRPGRSGMLINWFS